MRDAKDLLRPLDRLEPPDLWGEASGRTPGRLPPGPSSRSARVAVVLVSAVVAVAGMVLVFRAFGGGPDARPAGEITYGKIAVAREGCDGEVFLCREPAHIVLVNPDGSDERDIGEGATPAWSPDGTRLAYAAGGAGAIYIVNADGAHQTSVVSCDEPDCVSVMSPTWSPDGTQLAFMAEHTGRSGRDSEVDIWVVNADGTDGHAVTACRRPDCSSNFAPAWSPSGNEVAMWSMVRCGDGWGPSLRLLDLSTGDIRDVVSCVGSNGSRIAWSPDGRFLAFELHTDNGTGNIFTIAASGGSRTQVTSCDRTDCRWAYYPSWSPDGRWLLFAVKSEPEALFEVAEARPDGGEFKRLGIQGFMAAWQPVGAGPNTETTATPQGSSVCFESESTGDFDGDGVLDRVKLHALVPFERCSPDALETDWRFEIRVELASGTISTPFEDCPSLFDCELLGGSDLDGDGRDELAVILTNAATATTGLYRVAGSGVEPLKVEHPGDPDYLEPGPIVLGGNHDAISQAGFECLVKEARRVVVAWWAERDDGVSPYRLHLASLELRGDAFLVVATQDQKDVADLPALRGLCR